MPPFDDRQQQLLDAASTIFAERGFHATSMRDLARASGLSLAGIYHYVAGKQELLFLIQERCFAEVEAGARAALASETDPRVRLETFIRHHVTFFAAHMAEMKVLSHEEDELEGTMRARIRQRKRAYVALLHQLLRATPGAGTDHHLAGYALFGMMNWIYTWYHPTGAIPPEALAAQMARLFLDGFVPSPTHATARLVATHGG